MPILPIVVALIAAGAILLIVIGLAGGSRRSTRSRRVSPSSGRCRPEPRGARAPAALLRADAPTARRAGSRAASRGSRRRRSARTQKRLAMAGNPADLWVTEWLGMKAVFARSSPASASCSSCSSGWPIVILARVFGLGVGFVGPEFWLGRRSRRARRRSYG